jgi:hypothetical protein
MEASNNPHPNSSPKLRGLASSLIQAMHALRTSLLLTLVLTACDGRPGNKKTASTAPQKSSAPVFVTDNDWSNMGSWDKRPERKRHEPYYPERRHYPGKSPGPFNSINFKYKSLIDHHFTRLRTTFSDGHEADMKMFLLKFQADKKMDGLKSLKEHFNTSEERGQRRVSAIQMLFKICEGKADLEDPDVSAFVEFLKAYRKIEKAKDMKSYWKAYYEYVKVSQQTGYELVEIGKGPWNLYNKRRRLIKKEKESSRGKGADVKKQ